MRKSICEGKYNKRALFIVKNVLKSDNEFIFAIKILLQNNRFDLFLRTKRWAKLNFQSLKLFSPH